MDFQKLVDTNNHVAETLFVLSERMKIIRSQVDEWVRIVTYIIFSNLRLNIEIKYSMCLSNF